MIGTVVSLADRTGNMVRPWIEAGYLAVTVDLQPAANPMPGRIHVCADITALQPEFAAQFNPVAVFAFPPCTDLANSGARWFKDKGLSGLVGALGLVERCRLICEASGAPWALENPMGQLSTYWRQPDCKFDPCDYAGYAPDPATEAYTKLTCLWTGNGFRMPLPNRVPAALGSKMHLLPPTGDRADLRSVTPLGFAYAVFHEMTRRSVAA